MYMKKLSVIAVVLLAVFIASCKEAQKVSFQTSRVERGNIQNSITATGTIEPVTSVTVGTQVSGIVSHLYVVGTEHAELRAGKL